MQVEGTVRKLEKVGRNDLAVVGEDDELGSEGHDLRDRLRRAKASRCQNGADAQKLGGVGDGGRARRSGDDTDQLDVRLSGETPQGLDPEPAAAEEDGPHARAA